MNVAGAQQNQWPREVVREIDGAIGGCGRRVLSKTSGLLNAFRQSTFSGSEHDRQPLRYVSELAHLRYLSTGTWRQSTHDQPAPGRTAVSTAIPVVASAMFVTPVPSMLDSGEVSVIAVGRVGGCCSPSNRSARR